MEEHPLAELDEDELPPVPHLGALGQVRHRLVLIGEGEERLEEMLADGGA